MVIYAHTILITTYIVQLRALTFKSLGLASKNPQNSALIPLLVTTHPDIGMINDRPMSPTHEGLSLIEFWDFYLSFIHNLERFSECAEAYKIIQLTNPRAYKVPTSLKPTKLQYTIRYRPQHSLSYIQQDSYQLIRYISAS
jgi:hypothetical protein